MSTPISARWRRAGITRLGGPQGPWWPVVAADLRLAPNPPVPKSIPGPPAPATGSASPAASRGAGTGFFGGRRTLPDAERPFRPRTPRRPRRRSSSRSMSGKRCRHGLFNPKHAVPRPSRSQPFFLPNPIDRSRDSQRLQIHPSAPRRPIRRSGWFGPGAMTGIHPSKSRHHDHTFEPSTPRFPPRPCRQPFPLRHLAPRLRRPGRIRLLLELQRRPQVGAGVLAQVIASGEGRGWLRVCPKGRARFLDPLARRP